MKEERDDFVAPEQSELAEEQRDKLGPREVVSNQPLVRA